MPIFPKKIPAIFIYGHQLAVYYVIAAYKIRTQSINIKYVIFLGMTYSVLAFSINVSVRVLVILESIQ